MDQQHTVTDVARPQGAVLPNWPLLLGAGFTVMIIIGLFLTGEPILPVTVDPLDVGDIPTIEAPLGDASVDGTIRGLEYDAQARLGELAAARAEADRIDAETQRRQLREQAEVQRQYREALATLEALRARPNQPEIDRALSSSLAETPDEVALMQTLRMEELRRRHDAFRAPVVASSARGLGGLQHALERPEITSTFGRFRTLAPDSPELGPAFSPRAPSTGSPARRPVSGLPISPQVSAFPPLPGAPGGPPIPPLGDYSGGLPPGAGRPPAGTGVPYPAQRSGAPPGAGSAPASGIGAPSLGAGTDPPADAAISGQFILGPRADGGRGQDAGVVVTPNDGPHYRVYEGDIIAAVLRTEIDGSYSGPIMAQVSRNVFSRRDRTKVLIPRGTTALGRAGSVTGPFSDRLAVSFHRLIFPDGRWLRLNFAGLNSVGQASLKDQVDRHYLQTFGSAGAVGILAGLSAGGSGGGAGVGGMRSGISEQMAMMGMQLMQQFLNRRPDVTIRAGHAINLYLTNDFIVPVDAAWQVE